MKETIFAILYTCIWIIVACIWAMEIIPWVKEYPSWYSIATTIIVFLGLFISFSIVATSSSYDYTNY